MSTSTINMDITPLQRLKYEALVRGVYPDELVHQEWTIRYGDIPMAVDGFVTSNGITMQLLGDQNHPIDYKTYSEYVNAICREGPPGDSGIRLTVIKGKFVLRWGLLTVPVEIYLPPKYHQETYLDSEGRTHRLTDAGVTHIDCVRLELLEGCLRRCKFCDIGGEPYLLNDQEVLLRALLAASTDQWRQAKHALISGGTPYPRHEQWWDDTVRYLVSSSPIPVDVMMEPRALRGVHPRTLDLGYPKRLKAMGVRGIYLNLDVWDKGDDDSDSKAKLWMPQKLAGRGGNEQFLTYIRKCVEVFQGNVWSIIIFGRDAIEPTSYTESAIRAVAEAGAHPILSPFVAGPGTALEDALSPNLVEILEVIHIARRLCAEFNVSLGHACRQCRISTVP